MTTAAGAGGEDPLGRGARLGGGVGDLPGGHGQALGDEQRLGVGFLDLHAMAGSAGRATSARRPGRLMVAASDERRTREDRNEPRPVASPYSVSAATWAAPPPRGVMQRDLVERARQGDHDAFAALAGAAISRLDAAAWLILRDPEQAKDAVQNTLVRAWRDLPTLRSPDRFDAWLHRLLYRACIDEARRLRRHRVDVELTPIDPPVVDDMSRRSPTATSSNVASAAWSRRRGRSSSFITTSTCHCRRSPSRSGSRSGRRNRACTVRSGSMRAALDADARPRSEITEGRLA